MFLIMQIYSPQNILQLPKFLTFTLLNIKEIARLQQSGTYIWFQFQQSKSTFLQKHIKKSKILLQVPLKYVETEVWLWFLTTGVVCFRDEHRLIFLKTFCILTDREMRQVNYETTVILIVIFNPLSFKILHIKDLVSYIAADYLCQK